MLGLTGNSHTETDRQFVDCVEERQALQRAAQRPQRLLSPLTLHSSRHSAGTFHTTVPFKTHVFALDVSPIGSNLDFHSSSSLN